MQVTFLVVFNDRTNSRDVLAWLAAHGLGKDARSLALLNGDADHINQPGMERAVMPPMTSSGPKPPSPLNYIPLSESTISVSGATS